MNFVCDYVTFEFPLDQLSDNKALQIYNDTTRSITELAERYRVSQSLITSIRKKERHAKLLEGLPEPDRFDHRKVAKNRKLTDARS
jgi:hypothetical protein